MMNEQCEGEGWLVIRQSMKGLGVFATKFIPVNTCLFIIWGPKLNFEDTTTLNQKESYCLQVTEKEYIFLQAPFCFCNHSCDPNCGIRQGKFFITIREVHEGEELTWDYSTSMFERHWTMDCACNTHACRKIIKDFDFLPHHIQKKYNKLDIIMPFIKNKLYSTLMEYKRLYGFQF
jgi:hypothetical protein